MTEKGFEASQIRMKPDLGYGIWNLTHLYINDDGVCYCGRHMGVESTYMPHAWSDLGETASVVNEGVVIRCEDPRCTPVVQREN